MNMKKLIMLYFFLAGGIAANTKNIDYTYLKMQSAPFEVDDDYLSKHDIVLFFTYATGGGRLSDG